MSRLYDRVMNGCKPPPGSGSTMPWGRLGEATVIDANNVARYFLEHPLEERRKLAGNMPNLAPPIETVFIEASAPTGVPVENFQGNKYEKMERLYSWAALGHSHDWGEDEEANREFLASIGKESWWKYGGQIRWIERIWTFAEPSRKSPVGPIVYVTFAISADGGTPKDENGEPLWDFDRDRNPLSDDLAPLEGLDREKMRTLDPVQRRALKARVAGLEGRLGREAEALKYARDLAAASIDFLDSLLLSVSFMHCKNVVLSPVEPPRKSSLKHERKHGSPLSRYHILEIEPMKTVLKTEGRVEEVGLKRALHIARGHFRTYSEEKPLFGKFAGTVWIAQHARGSRDRGEVAKDYAIKRPS